MEKLKEQVLELFRKYPDNISFSLLKRHIRIGTPTANRIIEQLENEGIISKRDKDGKRFLLEK